MAVVTAVVAFELFIGISENHLGAMFVGGAIVLSWLAGWRQERMRRLMLHRVAALRAGQTICEFARDFDLRNVDPWVVRAVYEELQSENVDLAPRFPIREQDELEGFLVMDPDDLDLTIVPIVAQRTGRSLSSSEANPFFGRIRTAGDLVLFFNAQPRADAT